MTSSGALSSIEFYTDPMCPWAYQAALWIRDVRSQTGLGVEWRFFSLEEINRKQGGKHPWERPWSYGWSLMRIGALLRRKDPGLLDQWLAACGRAFHEEGREVFTREGAEEVAAELGLAPETIGNALADPTTHDDVRAEHQRCVGTYAAFGVPTLVMPPGRAVFGPVITPAPTGQEALRLWDLVQAWASVRNLYEMQTPKRARDVREIAVSFEPTLSARRWPSVRNPAP